MKKYLWLLAIPMVALAASTYTTNYSLEKPADGDATSSWNEAFRDNMDTIDSQMDNNADSITAHISDSSDAHDASAISVDDSSFFVCTSNENAQSQLACLDDAINDIAGGGAVDLTSAQTISGLKTFSTSPKLSALSNGVLHVTSGDGTLASSTIVNADVDSSAAIARTKLASGTASHVLINDGSGVMSSEAQLSAARGGIGLDGSAATNGFLPIGNGSGFTLAGISGTSNQVTVTNGAGTITLSTPQNLHTAATPTFATTTLDTSLVLGDTGGGTNTITVQAPADADLTANYTLTLPQNDGSSNQVLQTDGNGVTSWATVATTNLGVATKASADSPYTVLTSDQVLLCNDASGSVTFNLFTAVGNTGAVLRFKKTASGTTNTCIIDGNASETIDGATTFVLAIQYDEITIVSDGSNWQIIDKTLVQPSALVYRSSTQNITGGSGLLIMNGEVSDSHSAHNSTTGVFTMPAAGDLVINGHFNIDDVTAASATSVRVRVNSTETYRFQSYESFSSTTTTVIVVPLIIRGLAKGDTVDFNFVSADTNVNVTGGSTPYITNLSLGVIR